MPLWWPIDGVCACPLGKRCESPGKHPMTTNGLHDATTDADTVTRWWARAPEANIGIRTGDAFDVLDLDGDEAGPWLARYADERGADTAECWGWGPMVATGKGSHLYYAPTGAGNRAKVVGVSGFDWRGRGGYVVAPPSLHFTGRRYEWAPDCGPDSPIPTAPDSLVELVAGPAPARRADPRPIAPPRGGWSPHGVIGKMATAAEGERNNVLVWAAWKIGGDVHDGKIGRGHRARCPGVPRRRRRTHRARLS